MPKALKVFLVEQDEEEAMLLRADLDEDTLPFRVEWEGASSLEEALRQIPHSGADVILLDLELPDSTGLRTLRRVREAAPGVAVVVMLPEDGPETAVAAVREGAEDVLVLGSESPATTARRLRLAVERLRVRLGQTAAPGQAADRVLWTV